MFPAGLAMVLFALSSVTARRSVRYLGSNTANLARITLASALLALYAHTLGAGLRGPALGWFLLSGIIGYGICDTAIFLALPRLGAQITTLIVQCLSVPIALLTEWLWLGTSLFPTQLAAIGVILAGVATALYPAGRGPGPAVGPEIRAVLLGVLAAVGQAWGAVLSRHGMQVSDAAGRPLDGLSVAYQRILAGLVFTFGWWVWQRHRSGATPAPVAGSVSGPAWPWVLLNALAGPALGVACYQWALSLQPTGVVLSITALAPLAVIPLAVWIEHERPTRRSVVGGIVAVLGVVWLARHR